MRMKTSLFKRSLAALLCFVMLLGMFPALGFAPVALADETETDDTTGDGTTGGSTTGPQGNYITLPITVRDFAADGMLFEYNEVDRATFTARNEDGTFTWGDPNEVIITDRFTYDQTGVGTNGAIDHSVREAWKCYFNLTSWDQPGHYRGIRVYELADYADYAVPPSDMNLPSWYCLLLDADGNVLKVLESVEEKRNFSTTISNTAGAAFAVWTWRDPINLPYYNLIAKITDTNKYIYRFYFDGITNYTNATADLYLGRRVYLNASEYTEVLRSGTENTDEPIYDIVGIYVYDGDKSGSVINGLGAYKDWWHCIVYNASTNQVVDVLPRGDDKTDISATYLTSSYKLALVHYNKTNMELYDELAQITDANASEYQIVILQNDGTIYDQAGPVLFIERTITVHEANTRGFGLLFTKSSDMFHNLYDDPTVNYGTIAGTLLEDNDPTDVPGYFGTNVSPYKTVYIWNETVTEENPLTAHVSQDLYYGTIRTGLVSNELDKDTKKPVYTDATVNYLADYMSKVMSYGEFYDGNYYSFHVMGVKMFREDKTYAGPEHPEAVYDLADLIRFQMDNSTETDKMGTPSASAAKFKAGTLSTYAGISTWCDAAYFLLHNTWQDSSLDVDEENNDGYGMPMRNYHSLHLMETTNADGQTCYVFNAKYSNTVYDSGEGEIYNTPFGTYTAEDRPYAGAYDKNETTEATSSGIKLPYLRFDPLGPASTGGWQGYKKAGSMNTYGELTGTEVSQNWSEYYDDTNYHMSLEGHAQFVYQYDANQYFTFTGDDDVYLYINGYRVLDIGGAHGIAKVRIDINDVAKKIGLQNGGTYSFDFFYMERHGTAANFGIETNIEIADASMNTVKQGYQNGVNTGYGGPVNADNHVGYSFEIQNNGTSEIYNLTFKDEDIGVYVGYDKIELNSQLKADGTPLYTFANDIYLIYWDDDGTMHYYAPGSEDLTEKFVMDRLKQGLKPKERLGVYGFKYLVQPNQWVDTDNDGTTDTFVNTVYTTATNTPGTPTGATKTLHGVADWKVVKMQHPYDAFRVYDWVHKRVSNDPADAADLTWKAPGVNGIPASNSVTVSKEYLIEEYLIDNVNIMALTDAQKANINIVLCTAAGNKDEYFINPNVKKDTESGGITYTSTTVGKDTVFFVFEGVTKDDGTANKVYDSLVFSYEVYTYGAVDNVYVLDYGLPVELAGSNFGFHTNDHLQLNENNREMTAVVTGLVDADGKEITSKTGTYGDFAWSTSVNAEGKTIPSLKYTPDAIINGTDEVYAKFRIVEDGAEEFSIYTGVEMVQKITTAPANVVYYEDTFPGITFIEGDENGSTWVEYHTVKDGKPVSGIEQSANQDLNYGEDPNYKDDKEGQLVPSDEDDKAILDTTLTATPESMQAIQNAGIDYINKYLGLGGSDSNGTVKAMVVMNDADVLSFEFVGTGFEIISRTTQNNFAIVNAQIEKKVNGQWKAVRFKVVITESIGGTLYQVPIISVTGLEKAEYRVRLRAAGSTATATRVLYIDGIRIYGPLDKDEALEYYNPEEYHSEILEVKQLIKGGKVIYGTASDSTGQLVVTGQTLIENQNTNEVLTALKSVDQYLQVGPNNELYLEGTLNGIIAFWLVPKQYVDDTVEDADKVPYPDYARTLEIGAHRKTDSKPASGDSSDVYLVYGDTVSEILTPVENRYTVSSGTEMYYTIDMDHLTYDKANNRYLVMIGTNGGVDDESNNCLALTNIKVAGYDIMKVEDAIWNRNDQNTGDGSTEGGNAEGGTTGGENTGDTNQTETTSIVKAMFSLLDALANPEIQEPEADNTLVNENLTFGEISLRSNEIVSGKSIKLTVSATMDAARIVVTDSNGNEVEYTKYETAVENGQMVFRVNWKGYGNRGDKLVYTIRVFDANNLASVNTETITVTIV